jgi:hypothetical protein
MKVSNSKAKVNVASGDGRNHGGKDELAQLLGSMKTMQQSHAQMLQQQQQQFEAQIAALVPHGRQQVPQGASSNHHSTYQATT